MEFDVATFVAVLAAFLLAQVLMTLVLQPLLAKVKTYMYDATE